MFMLPLSYMHCPAEARLTCMSCSENAAQIYFCYPGWNRQQALSSGSARKSSQQHWWSRAAPLHISSSATLVFWRWRGRGAASTRILWVDHSYNSSDIAQGAFRQLINLIRKMHVTLGCQFTRTTGKKKTYQVSRLSQALRFHLRTQQNIQLHKSLHYGIGNSHQHHTNTPTIQSQRRFNIQKNLIKPSNSKWDSAAFLSE